MVFLGNNLQEMVPSEISSSSLLSVSSRPISLPLTFLVDLSSLELSSLVVVLPLGLLWCSSESSVSVGCNS